MERRREKGTEGEGQEKRERLRKREKDAETDRARETEKERERERQRQTDRERERQSRQFCVSLSLCTVSTVLQCRSLNYVGVKWSRHVSVFLSCGTTSKQVACTIESVTSTAFSKYRVSMQKPISECSTGGRAIGQCVLRTNAYFGVSLGLCGTIAIRYAYVGFSVFAPCVGTSVCQADVVCVNRSLHRACVWPFARNPQ